MQASRPGRTRPGSREGVRAGWRLASLILCLIALSGHSRPGLSGHRDMPEPDALGATLAEVWVERSGSVVTRGSAVPIAARQESGETACYLLTAGHVVADGQADATRLVVVLPGQDGGRVYGELLHQVDLDDRDLAVLRTVGPPCHPVRLGSPLAPGADVWLGGFAVAGAPGIWPGHVRDTNRQGGLSWIVDGSATEGTSGGGVFDARSGGLVGLIQGYWAVRVVIPGGRVAGEAPADMAAVIPIARVRTLLREWGFEDLLGE
jgi:hypothetical protein